MEVWKREEDVDRAKIVDCIATEDDEPVVIPPQKARKLEEFRLISRDEPAETARKRLESDGSELR